MDKEKYVNDILPEIAKRTSQLLPEGYGFVTLAFKFGEHNGDRLMYISNADRKDVAKAMKEWCDKVDSEEKFGKDL